jgi:hypothetical protein
MVRRMPGHRRVLGVAMDNSVDLPGYKFFRDPRDGSRPDVYVAFADLVEAAGAPPVNGVCIPVDAAALAVLDARERQYGRAEVTALLEDPPGPTWAYLGSEPGRARFARGMAEGRAVVVRGYVETVQAGFRALGSDEHRAFVASTDLSGVPVVALERVDLPE